MWFKNGFDDIWVSFMVKLVNLLIFLFHKINNVWKELVFKKTSKSF